MDRERAISVRSEVPGLDVDAPPFERNPSAWSQRVPIAVIAAFGFVAASYLALFQWGLVDEAWDPIFGDGTETVLESKPSQRMHRWFGIPDAAFGALAYLGDAIWGLAGSTRRWQYRPWMVILFGIDVIPLGIVSVILVVVQGTVVGSWCTLCLFTALVSLVLIGFAYDEVWATIKYLHRVWRETHDAKLLWKVFWGGYDARADHVACPEGACHEHKDVTTTPDEGPDGAPAYKGAV